MDAKPELSSDRAMRLLEEASDVEAIMIGGISWRELNRKFLDPEFNSVEFFKSLSKDDLDKVLELQRPLYDPELQNDSANEEGKRLEDKTKKRKKLRLVNYSYDANTGRKIIKVPSAD